MMPPLLFDLTDAFAMCYNDVGKRRRETEHMTTPCFWKTTLAEIDAAFEGATRVTEKRVLGHSAGGRPIYMLAYGQKKKRGSANYSSALGAHDRTCYAPKGQTPTVVIIGAEHGAETEGVAAIMNLISLLETGVDLNGQPDPDLLLAAQSVRVVILPVANPDGRARVEPSAMVGLTGKELRYWAQGTWTDGSLCGWPECKRVHPILGRTAFLGGYYNDDGINVMHDNFFHPMARETQAILDLCEDEAADYVLHLHGGSNSKGDLLQPFYVTEEVNQKIRVLNERCIVAGERENLEFGSPRALPAVAKGKNPPTFNLVCAAHHVCGGVSVCYESNECVIDEPGNHLTHAEIVRMHMILFTETFLSANEKGEDI